jgi:tetratricopeptide (TPR) repeat protein
VWQALERFERAVAKDPNFAPAYAALASACGTVGAWESGLLPPAQALAKAKTAAARALELDPQLPAGHTAMGYTRLHFDWNADASLQDGRLGRGAEAVTTLRKSVECSSNSPVMLAGLGHALAVFVERRDALRIARDLQRMRGDEDLFAYELGVIHAALGDREAAFTWLALAVEERYGWIAYLRVDRHGTPR